MKFSWWAFTGTLVLCLVVLGSIIFLPEYALGWIIGTLWVLGVCTIAGIVLGND